MALMAQTTVTCPECNREHIFELVQSVESTRDREHKRRLLDGTLNLFECPCGKKAQLMGRLVYSDSAKNFFCQVCPSGAEEIERARSAFQTAGVAGTHRIVPSIKAVVEKVKMVDAGLDDWAVELTKALLLSSLGDDAINRVLLFDALDETKGQFSWVLFDNENRHPSHVHSPLGPYTRAKETWKPFEPRGEPLIDRRWAVETLQNVVAPTD